MTSDIGFAKEHHPLSECLMDHLMVADKDDYFCWKRGGDGDNGEVLMDHLDSFFEETSEEVVLHKSNNIKRLLDLLLGPEKDVKNIPIEEVMEELKKEGIDPGPLTKWMQERLAKIDEKETP